MATLKETLKPAADDPELGEQVAALCQAFTQFLHLTSHCSIEANLLFVKAARQAVDNSPMNCDQCRAGAHLVLDGLGRRTKCTTDHAELNAQRQAAPRN